MELWSELRAWDAALLDGFWPCHFLVCVTLGWWSLMLPFPSLETGSQWRGGRVAEGREWTCGAEQSTGEASPQPRARCQQPVPRSLGSSELDLQERCELELGSAPAPQALSGGPPSLPRHGLGGRGGGLPLPPPPSLPPPQGPKPHRRERLKVKTKLFLREELLLDPGLGTFC